MQENRRWVTNDRDLRWKGATVFNVPLRQLTKGNTGGLVVVVNPKVKCQLVACKNPEAYRFENADTLVDPVHRKQEGWENCEELIPDADLDLPLLEWCTGSGDKTETTNAPLNNITNRNSISRGTRREVRRRQAAQATTTTTTGTGQQTNPTSQGQEELVQ